MSISTTSTKDSYQGNNSIVTQYPITFKYFEESHISVYFDGVLQTKGAGADYVMGGDGTTSTGYITTNVAQADTVKVAITLDIPLDQPVVLQETGSLPAKTIEVEGFDRLNMQVRRVWRKLQDVLTFNTDEANGSTGTADNLLGFDGSGDIAEIPNTTFAQTANDLSDLNDAATARTNLGVDAAGTDNSTDVTKTGAGTYISLAGQVLTVDAITESDISNLGAYIENVTGSPLSELQDVTITTPSTSQVLAWNGSAWVNTTAGNGDMVVATYDPDNNALPIGTVQGTGANTRNIAAADEGTVAGDARGEYSVDLQTSRTAADQVAFGANSVLVGGWDNKAVGSGSAVIGSQGCTATGNYSFVAGSTNTCSSARGFVGGGINNDITSTGLNNAVIGGSNNDITGTLGNGVIVGGQNNTVSGTYAVTIGGLTNTASGNITIAAGEQATASNNGSRVFADSTITAFPSIADQEFAVQASALRLDDGNQGTGKVLTSDANGSGNWADTTNGTVQGTGATTLNIVASDEGTIAGNVRGEESVDLQMERDTATQVASGLNSVLVGGKLSTASGAQSSVIGGGNNDAKAYASAVIGGNNNEISGSTNYSVIAGGLDNLITSTGNSNAIVNGFGNDITGTAANAIIAGGGGNEASANYAGTFAGNRNIASGVGAVVLGGEDSTASGTGSLVAGDNGRAIHNGARVFANGADTDFPSIQVNEFAIQGAALRLVDTYQGAGNVLTSDANGSGNWAHPAKPVYTVATLPATPAQGDVAMVTDAEAPTFLSAVASGGGADVVTPVFYNGTAWIVG